MLKIYWINQLLMENYNCQFNKNLYKNKYHDVDISSYHFLITGGAGFIGSNIVEYLLKNNAGKVRVLDDLSNGYFDNIKDFLNLPNFEFIEGDIRSLKICQEAINDIDFVLHQAALGSVPRSIENPILSNEVNVNGFLNMLEAVRSNNKVIRMVYAASSSTYGDSSQLPKVEGIEGRPLSPYAVTKLVNELYADVYFKVYGLKTVGLRYFNVFGPKQNPNNPYAAVIPLFCKKIIENENPVIFGDGETSRDFTFVENVVQANIKALFSQKIKSHQVFNVACNESISLNRLVSLINTIANKEIAAIYKDERNGDIKHSLASIKKAIEFIGYTPEYNFKQGLEIVYNWYVENYKV
jgi:UDP-N-acetylglucosamine 4-epimerase